MLARPLIETIVAAASALDQARDPWWIISSAAAAIHGAHPSTVGDVDILLSHGDAERLFPQLGIVPAPASDHPRFRSDLFGRWTAAPLIVEFMVGFSLRDDDGRWRLVQPEIRLAARVAATIVFMPALYELREMFARFGRPKDIARIDLLDHLG